MAKEKLSFVSRLSNAGMLVRAAVGEMIGRDDLMVGNVMGKIKARFQGYKEVSTYDVSRTSYSFARAIFFANTYTDRKTGKEYGRDYLLGAPFGKPVVNIAAGFAVGSPVQIVESSEITEDDDTVDDMQDDPIDTDTLDVLSSNSTVSNTNRMLQDRRDSIFKAVRNSYRDGDFFIAVEDDGEFTLLPPEDVDIVVNAYSPDEIDGYDVFSTFPDSKDSSGANVLMFVDEIRRSYRRRCAIDKTGKRTEVAGTLVEYRNEADGGLEERELPIVHFANEKEARSLYGTSEFQNLYFLMANYHEVLSAAIKGNIYNSTAVPVIQGVKNMKQFLQQNFTQDKDGNYILKWDSQKMLVVGEGGSVQILQADGTAADAQTLLEILFYLLCQSSETPEFAFGTAVQSSKASVSEQTPMLIKKAVRKQGELEAPLRKLVELYITRMASIRPEEFDASIEFTITMPSILDEDLNINLQIVNALLEKGIITEETAMTMLNLGKYVKNFEDERRRAQAQKKERSPIPTDVFGQPITDKDTEDLNRNKAKDNLNDAKQAEIEEMLKHKDTKSVAEMLSRNIDSLTLEQIQEMNPHRSSEGKGPKAIQETKAVPVKSGNPYRQSGGRFGSGPKKAGDDSSTKSNEAIGISDSSTSEEVEAFIDSFKNRSAVERTSEFYDRLGYNDVAKPFKGGTDIYRYETADTVAQAEKYKNAIMSKDRRFPSAGNNMFGVGTYFGDSLDKVSFYKKDTSVLVSGRLAPGTKIADFKSIHEFRGRLFKKHSDLISRNMAAASVFSEYGLLAAGLGYGAIRTSDGYIVVLDRRKLNVN